MTISALSYVTAVLLAIKAYFALGNLWRLPILLEASPNVPRRALIFTLLQKGTFCFLLAVTCIAARHDLAETRLGLFMCTISAIYFAFDALVVENVLPAARKRFNVAGVTGLAIVVCFVLIASSNTHAA